MKNKLPKNIGEYEKELMNDTSKIYRNLNELRSFPQTRDIVSYMGRGGAALMLQVWGSDIKADQLPEGVYTASKDGIFYHGIEGRDDAIDAFKLLNKNG